MFAFVCVFVQVPVAQETASTTEKAASRTVTSLTSNACPRVQTGEFVAFDWNPAFDPSWAVSGLQSLRLTFDRVGEDGLAVRSMSRLSLGRDAATSIASIGNGYFHVEVPLRGRMVPGTYRLVDAQGIPQVAADYHGPAPRATNSPAREFYCITLVAPPRLPSPAVGP
jgi:hypothetical protein